MNKNNITKLFEDVVLYETKSFKLYTDFDNNYSKIAKNDLINIQDYLCLLSKEKLITKCIDCDKTFPFTYKIQLTNYKDDSDSINLGEVQRFQRIYLKVNENMNVKDYLIINDSKENQTVFLDYYFTCSNDYEHNYKMSFIINIDNYNLKITKIGQYPECTILGNYTCDNNKNILRKLGDSYLDYRSAEKSFKYGLYAGAYDYLRRAYEKIINYYLKKNKIDDNNSNRMTEKIDLIKSEFDSEIRDLLVPLYSALSVGVHSLKEEECKEYFYELKTIIDLQLQYEKALDERKDKLRESSNVLNELKEKYSK